MDDEKTENSGGPIEHSLLPPAAMRILREAASTQPDPASLDPELQRRKAIDRAHATIKARWPQLFRD